MQIHFSPQLSAIVEERDRIIPRLWKPRFSQSGTELITTVLPLGRANSLRYVSALWDLDSITKPGSKANRPAVHLETIV